MARPLDLVVEEMLDYIEQAVSYVSGMTFEQYAADRKTQRAVERCIEVISEGSRHIPDEIKAKRPDIPSRDVATIGNVFRHEYHTIAPRIVWQTVLMTILHQSYLARIKRQRNRAWVECCSPQLNQLVFLVGHFCFGIHPP